MEIKLEQGVINDDDPYFQSDEFKAYCQEMDAFNALVDQYWAIVKDHPDECDCIDCWEYYVLTEK